MRIARIFQVVLLYYFMSTGFKINSVELEGKQRLGLKIVIVSLVSFIVYEKLKLM